MRNLDIVGKTLQEAQNIIHSAGYSFRIVRRDKDHYVCTRDLRKDRVNLELDKGLITSYNFG